MSTITREKGGSTAGIGLSGATGILLLGFPTTWHRWQHLINFATSRLMLGQ